MNPLTVALLTLAALALVLVIVTLRRPGPTSTGRLTPSTLRVDRGPVSLSTPLSSAAVEAAPAAMADAHRHARSGEALSPDPETIGVTRRQFLNRSITAVFGLGLAAFGAAAVAFLWPPPATDFGSKINLGRIADLKKAIAKGSGFHYVPEGRMWITEYPPSALERARSSYGFFDQVEPGLRGGVTALYQVCPHLGCRVPECTSSQWFECPCHGSKYNRVGEKKAGPAPRGMDRFPMEVNAAGELIVDTSVIILGPPIGTNTTGQEAEGPNCIGEEQPHI